jgi:hypothetical protein
MIFKVKVKRDKQPKDDMHSFFCGDTAEVIINGQKHQVKGDSRSVMDGIDLDGVIMGRVLDTVMASWNFEPHGDFIYWFGFWHCNKEMYEFIARYDGRSEYEIDSEELRGIYDRWAEVELPKIKERNRKWEEEQKKLEKEGKGSWLNVKCEKIVIDTQPISSDFKVKWSDVDWKPYNPIEIAKRRAQATTQLAEDQKFMNLLKTAKKVKKKTKKKKRKKPECPHKMYKWKDTLCKFTDTLCKGEKYCSDRRRK